MRSLNIIECTKISAASGQNKMVMVCAAGLVGGIATGAFMNAIGPLATFIGTPAGAIGFGIVCTPFAPGIGTIGCGIGGGFLGYYLSSSLATVSGFCAGGVATATLTYMNT
jgi:hypothetical protein